ncbi:hypothetical protein BaRGS_00030177 [Batillaria attramentaria]|uniref:Fucolectin-related molecule n=1 Tax=Batillaria attramentaria TaxID=370345 RepID=A0ABD0JUJ7_9CAEN
MATCSVRLYLLALVLGTGLSRNYSEIDLTSSTQPCGMSSAWLLNGARSDCHAAINGNNDTKFLLLTTQQNCIHTDRGDRTPLWWVDMLKQYTVHWIRLYVRSGQKHRMTHLHVTLDQQPVYDSGSEIPSGSYIDIHDNNRLPYKGRNLTIGRTAASDHFINICEVRVWECADGYYGTDCQYTCGHCEGEATCDKVTGHCTSCDSGFQMPLCECSDGRYGENCSGTCGHCTAACDKVTGDCAECGGPYKMPVCKEECPDGSYAPNCVRKCGQCNKGLPCGKMTGNCTSCEPGWIPLLCQKECPDGRYGQSCGHTCGHCKDGAACNKSNGHCISCNGTYAMPFCQQDAGGGGDNFVGPITGAVVGAAVFVGLSVVMSAFLKSFLTEASHLNTSYQNTHTGNIYVAHSHTILIAETALDYVTLGDATHEAEPASEDLEANYENTQFERTHDTGPEPGASDSDHYERLQVQRGNQDDVSPYEALPVGQQGETPAAKKPAYNSKSAKRAKGTCASGENVYENTRFARRK